MNFFEKLLEYIFVPSCGICNTLGHGYLCKKCEKQLEKYKINLIEYEYINNIIIEKIFIFKYENLIRTKILEYKFGDKAYLYKMFGKIILNDKKICGLLEKYDIIIPVPIHKKRKNKRGYNQCELITKEIAKNLNIINYSNVLIKYGKNEVQSTLSKKERIKNVKNVYKIINEEKINNKNILIFDDIYTTGATVNECIKTLEKAKICKIGVLILAKD